MRSLSKRLRLALRLAVAAALLCSQPAAAASAPDNSAQSVILVEAGSGEVLYAKNEDCRARIASTTKILTALVVLERCQTDESVTIRPEWTGIEGSSMGLRAGESYTVGQLLYGMLLVSGNDAATALACHTAGSVEAFAALMNEKARALGMCDSHFTNPHGLDDEAHYATARDMARLACAAMENEIFRAIVSTKEICVGGRWLKNHNKLLWNCEGAVGIKTGYTKKAGRTLVSCAERGGMRLICVTLGDPDDWRDHAALYDWAEANYRVLTLPDAAELRRPVISGTADTVALRPERDVSLLLRAGEEGEVRCCLPPFFYAPVEAGARAGEARLYVNGEMRASVPLVFAERVPLDPAVPLSRWETIKWAWYRANEHGAVRPILYH